MKLDVYFEKDTHRLVSIYFNEAKDDFQCSRPFYGGRLTGFTIE